VKGMDSREYMAATPPIYSLWIVQNRTPNNWWPFLKKTW